jgi:hypothetical protein
LHTQVYAYGKRTFCPNMSPCVRFLPAIGSFHWVVFRVTPAYIDSGHSARGIRIWFRMETLNKRYILKIKPVVLVLYITFMRQCLAEAFSILKLQ